MTEFERLRSATRVQRAARAMIERRREHQRRTVAQIMRQTREHLRVRKAESHVEEPRSASVQVEEALGQSFSALQLSSSASLQERLEELQRVVVTERQRISALEAECEQPLRALPLDGSQYLEGNTTMTSPQRALACSPSLSAPALTASPTDAKLASRVAPASMQGSPASGSVLSASVIEFTRLEHECGVSPFEKKQRSAQQEASEEWHGPSIPVPQHFASSPQGAKGANISATESAWLDRVVVSAVTVEPATQPATPPLVLDPPGAGDETASLMEYSDPVSCYTFTAANATSKALASVCSCLRETLPSTEPHGFLGVYSDSTQNFMPAHDSSSPGFSAQSFATRPKGAASTPSASALNLSQGNLSAILEFLDESENLPPQNATRRNNGNDGLDSSSLLTPASLQGLKAPLADTGIAGVPGSLPKFLSSRDRFAEHGVPETEVSSLTDVHNKRSSVPINTGGECRFSSPPAGVPKPPSSADRESEGGSTTHSRGAQLAQTVYAGVKTKMAAMKAELHALRDRSSELQAALIDKDAEVEAARRAAESQAASQAAAAKAAADEAVGRHLAFIDRLLADKAELSRQCENLAAQLKAQEERHAAAEEKREEAYSREMKRQKEMWAAGEKTRREQWVADKTKEIKEATVRGLEPDIQRLMARHREEMRRLEESLRDELSRQLAAEEARNEREAARLRAAADDERREAVHRERTACERRLAEMASQVENVAAAARSRERAGFIAEREADEARARREITRLEEELKVAKKAAIAVEEQARSDVDAARRDAESRIALAVHEAQDSHAAARLRWEENLESQVASRLEEEKRRLEAESVARRAEEIDKVVGKLSKEMAIAAKAADDRLQLERAKLKDAKAEASREAAKELAEMTAKYLAAVDNVTSLEARVDSLSEELASARMESSTISADAHSLREALAKERARTQEAVAHERSEAQAKLASTQGKCHALTSELEALRRSLALAGAAGANELAAAKQQHEREMLHVEARVRAAITRKDEALREAQDRLAASQRELHEVRQQLHATQQEILSMS